ncbi:hypothetical protein Lepto7375DRAFT_0461 [Leptolyngbya sp. PCC 7375]|nr:hypothetical protein Lepto7375DRAFT_0461 [Leptolyngbya sp. PCC 7375]
MLHTSDNHHLTRPLIKSILGIAIGLSCFGIGTKAYAWQEVYNARIVDYECLRDACTLTINKDHDITTSTASCTVRTFAWNQREESHIYRLVREAYRTNSRVRLRYSEYRCYDARSEGGERHMSLMDIWLQ